MTANIALQSIALSLIALSCFWKEKHQGGWQVLSSNYAAASSPVFTCDTTFSYTYGTPDITESAHAITAAPGGGFFLAGGRGNQAMISLLDAEANLIWSRQFNPTPDADDFITKIKLDSDGYLIGVGETKLLGGNVEVFAFKYDWQNDLIIWINELDIPDPALEGYNDIVEKEPGGNYFVIGHITPNGAIADVALLLEVDRNTGLNVNFKTFTLTDQQSFLRGTVFNNSFYVAGNFSALGRRPGIIRFDLNGNPLWTKVYILSLFPPSAEYFTPSGIVAGDGIVVFGFDSGGASSTNGLMFLFKTDLDGNLEWAKKIQIPSLPYDIPGSLIAMPDGYVCIGTGLKAGAPVSDIYIFKTDLQGNLMWSKRFIDPSLKTGKDLLWQNNLIYLTGTTKLAGGASDIFLASVKADGTSGAPANCDLINDLPINITDWPNPYEGSHVISAINYNAGFINNTATMQDVTLEQQVLCFNPCCETKPGPVFQNAIAGCAGDSLLVTLTVCNEGFVDFQEGAYLSFYSGDPTAGIAPLIGTYPTPQSVEPDSCLTFSVKISSITQPVFIVINDQGSQSQPIDLSGAGPSTDIEECDFTNNIGMLDASAVPLPLDMGPDTLGCPGDSLLLTASGFDHYQWLPDDLFDCDTCAAQFIVPQLDNILEVIVFASTTDGCFSADTIGVGAIDPVYSFDTTYFCPGDTLVIFGQPVSEPGEYVNVFPRVQGCDSIHQVTLRPFSNPFLQLPADLTIELGDSLQLEPNTSGVNMTWQWWPPDGLSCDDCRRPWARPFETTRYTLTVTDQNGCDASDEMLLTVLLNRVIFIPNAFSPNGDGINDVFLVFAGGNVARVRSFQLFDRWGEKIFEDFNFPPNDPEHGWDGFFKGKILDPAVFVYKAEVEYVDGAVEVFQGDVALVR